MRISKRTRYGLRLMIELALNYNKPPLSISAIAENEKISPKFLGQIIIPLKGAGLLQAERGAYGGYSLSKNPKEISLYEIYTVLEGEADIVECVNDEMECSRAGICVARNIWTDLNDTVVKTLSSITLADLVQEAEHIRGSISPSYQI
ncbi:MAG: Rrf2 family transcriptional regulator [Spirochaetales bacterium]|nr:Rrf2 family transcriptional regulator [Spirochaetales bacterium]